MFLQVYYIMQHLFRTANLGSSPLPGISVSKLMNAVQSLFNHNSDNIQNSGCLFYDNIQNMKACACMRDECIRGEYNSPYLQTCHEEICVKVLTRQRKHMHSSGCW